MTHTILSVPVSCLTAAQTLKKLQDHVLEPKAIAWTVFTVNPEILVLAHRSPEFRSVLLQADMCFPDGQGIVWASHGVITERVTGSDLLTQLLHFANAHHLSVGFVLKSGGLSTAADVQRLRQEQFPGCEFVTTTTAFPVPAPAIVFVSLGFPEQEHWCIDQRSNYQASRLVLTIGGALDFLTGKQRRAPVFFQTIGLEWLWRLVCQPRRIKRIGTAIIIFPYYLLRYGNSSH